MKNRMARFVTYLFVVVCLSSVPLAHVNANEPVIELSQKWPQEIVGDKGTVVIYQPQPEKLVDNVLTGRAAMALEYKNSTEPVFGVFWFTSIIETDRAANSVKLTQIKVIKVGWPDSKESEEQRFTDFVEGKLQGHTFKTDLSLLTASLTTAEKVQKSLDQIKNDPPKIIFKNTLSVLLSFDGKPIFKDIGNNNYQRAMNTPFVVVKDKTKTNQFYLTSGRFWYEAKKPEGPWAFTTSPPADLVSMMPEDQQEVERSKTAAVPEIVTATIPTELIVTAGNPAWKSLAGGSLLFVENTETPWLRELSTGDMYLLLSGRWFKSKTDKGPWVFVRGDKLPKSFQDIPPESDIAGLRTFVANTDEAELAILDTQIPQTAAVKRDEVTLKVEYDGKPKFVAIRGTEVAYAENTASQVLRIHDKYYAVENGIWFVAITPKGSWAVADSIPEDEIESIPPSSPVYNTTYVKVYDSTPEVVYVGYTPGYLWSYPYYGVPVYGTGWYYPPYRGGVYYPRTPTWGLHVSYNSWSGWNVGVSWGSPFFRVGFSWGGGHHHHHRTCCGGWHGGGFNHNDINFNGDINIGNTVISGDRKNLVNRGNLGNNVSRRENIYNRIDNNGQLKDRDFSTNPVNRSINRPSNSDVKDKLQTIDKSELKNKIDPNRTRAANGDVKDKLQTIDKSELKSKIDPNRTRPNNIYADKEGQVMRHQDGQWQKRENNQWKSKPRQVPTQKIDRNNIQRQRSHNLDRDLRGRNMGAQNRSRQARDGGGRVRRER